MTFDGALKEAAKRFGIDDEDIVNMSLNANTVFPNAGEKPIPEGREEEFVKRALKILKQTFRNELVNALNKKSNCNNN